MNSTVCLMAFGKIQETTEATEFKKYIGIAGCKVVAFNPTKEELSNLYGREITKDPEYYGVVKDNEGIVTIYEILEDGSQKEYEVTDISTEYLTETDKINIKNGIKVNGKQNLNQLIENFE